MSILVAGGLTPSMPFDPTRYQGSGVGVLYSAEISVPDDEASQAVRILREWEAAKPSYSSAAARRWRNQFLGTLGAVVILLIVVAIISPQLSAAIFFVILFGGFGLALTLSYLRAFRDGP